MQEKQRRPTARPLIRNRETPHLGVKLGCLLIGTDSSDSNGVRRRIAEEWRGDAPGTIRTCDLCLRRAALYPLSYGRSEPAQSSDGRSWVAEPGPTVSSASSGTSRLTYASAIAPPFVAAALVIRPTFFPS